LKSSTQPIPPGGTIGILGSGQLGRMLALAAGKLGLKTHVYCDASGPAFDVATSRTVAQFDDRAALAAFAAGVDAVTYEFENIPLATVRFLEDQVPVRPGAKALACAQDRLNEKQLARDLGVRTADFAGIDSLEQLQAQLGGAIPVPCVLKTRRFGYDGKGQAKILLPADAKAAWQAIGGKPAILEAFVTFASEVSVVAVRGSDGAFAAYDVTENEHRDHILHRSTVPARIAPQAAAHAVETAKRIGEALDYVGVFAVEFFCLDGNGDEAILVNEIAPRVHNSGHWTMDACLCSQFENHIRAVAGWPLGSTARHADAEMLNLIGAEVADWATLAAEPGVSVHLYGKREARAGRKMGHITRLLAQKVRRGAKS
jgi:5-(carboxyamino)imidazole ribonucleotide synthase